MKRISFVAAILLALGTGALAQHHDHKTDEPSCGSGEVILVHKDGSKHCVKEADVAKSCPGGGSAMRDCRTYGKCMYLCSDKLPPQ